jgi:ABC-type thiamine transport system ATPase subunit
VLILGPVVDQEQEPGSRQGLDQAVEQGLGFGIDPVQILKHQQQRLHLAFAQQQTLERLQDALPTLRGLKRQKWAIVRQGVQQR